MAVNDFYATFFLEKNGSEYLMKPRVPITLGSLHNAKVALCDVYYQNDNQQFFNIEKSGVEIAIPRYTTAKKNETRASDEVVNFQSCQLEMGEHTPETLCDQLNNEIKSKFPSEYSVEQCRFRYNKSIDRIELSLDGALRGVDKKDYVTLLIYYPMR